VFVAIISAGLFPWAGEGRSLDGAEPGVLYVYSHPAGAYVYMDGVRFEDAAPLKAEVSPGRHELRFELEGYEEELRGVEVAAGSRTVVRVQLSPLPERRAEDRKKAFEGAYIGGGMLRFRTLTSDIMLGSSLGEVRLRDEIRDADGLYIQLRYVYPIKDRAFLVADSAYQDARLEKHDIEFPGGELEKAELLLVRGGLELSIGPNLIDNLLPYAGGGFHYTQMRDVEENGLLGSDNQEDFLGYTAKAGFIWTTRRHIVLTGEYQYHWAYELEDYMLVGALAWRF